MKRLLVVLAVVVWGAGAARAQRFERGQEFQVNVYTTSFQDSPSVGVDAAGNFVVVWRSYFQDGSVSGVFARRFRANGVPRGAEFQVNSHATNHQSSPAIGTSPSGQFVVVWTSVGQDGSDSGLFGRRFASSGVLVGDEFQINTYTTGHQTSPSIGMDPGGNFVVSWRSYGDGSEYGIFGRLFDPSDAPVGDQFLVNTYTTSFQLSPSVRMDAAGNFIVAWNGQGPGALRSVFVRLFESGGAPLGAEFRASTYTTLIQSDPSIAVGPAGDFVVVWQSEIQPGPSHHDVFGRMFDSAGAPLGPEFQVNSYTTDSQLFPAVSMDASGSFVVVWRSDHDGSGAGVFGRRFDSSGMPLGEDFQVNTYTTGSQSGASVAMDAAGNFVVAWASDEQDGSVRGVFAQLFAGPPFLTAPLTGDTVVCGPRAGTPPTMTWVPAQYDRFRVYVSWHPGFEKERRISSGDTLLTSTSWTPSRKKWRRACAGALDSGMELVLYIQVLGVDVDVPKSDPARRNLGNVARVSLGF